MAVSATVACLRTRTRARAAARHRGGMHKRAIAAGDERIPGR